MKNFLKGIIKENPVLVLTLGICPALAVSTRVSSALGMGLATMFVLLCSNITISLTRKIIPDKVRIPCYIVMIAGFVSFTQILLEAYAYNLHQALGIFLPLIATNCVIFARAEMYAKKNTVKDSSVDALGMGAGFTLALVLIAVMREVFGSGTLFGVSLGVLTDYNIPIMTMAPGGFVVFGLLVAAVNKISKNKTKKEFGCGGCPSALFCKQKDENKHERSGV